jgi:hypothetical protein
MTAELIGAVIASFLHHAAEHLLATGVHSSIVDRFMGHLTHPNILDKVVAAHTGGAAPGSASDAPVTPG